MYIHGHFYNMQNERIEVRILTHADRSEEMVIGEEGGDLFFTDDPVELTSQVNDTFDHLLCQQATIRLLTRHYMPQLFCTSCLDVVVNILCDSTCLFAGYIEPQTYTQGYNEELDEIELSCIDTLTSLQYFNYRYIGIKSVLYQEVKMEAAQRTWLSIVEEIFRGITQGLMIGDDAAPCTLCYDGSKCVDVEAVTADPYGIFGHLSINELLFLGSEEDDVWTQQQVLEEMLRYLNLHLLQQGSDFYVFSWESIRADKALTWMDLISGQKRQWGLYTPQRITNSMVADADATISVCEVYNKIVLSCKVESMENLIESPMDGDLLKSPYKNYQKYMTEYSSPGEGDSAIRAFHTITHGGKTDYDVAKVTNWYLRVMNNPMWRFSPSGDTDIINAWCSEGTWQNRLPNSMTVSGRICAAVLALGKEEVDVTGKDNTPTASVNLTNYLAVSINGNGLTDPSAAWPNEEVIKSHIPVAEYVGSNSGGVFSPSDDTTCNYIVLSGSIVLNPLMELTDTYANILACSDRDIWKYQYSGCVYDRGNSDGRYYTQQWWEAKDPSQQPQWDQNTDRGFVPFTDTGPKHFIYNGSTYRGEDRVLKVGVLACQLVIGDKCVVETGTQGQIDDYEWRTYKTREQCASDEEYYSQSFTIGFDPKTGDYIVGQKHDMQQNFSHSLGIDAKGTAIRIRRSDKVSGRVTFRILGPVNLMYDGSLRYKPGFFGSYPGSEAVLATVGSILLENFEVKLYCDNALVNDNDDCDLVYMSDTDETFVNAKDDVELKINSALTYAECQQLEVSDGPKMSTPLNTLTGEGVTSIFCVNTDRTAKPERLYVDACYREWHQPRVMLTQNLMGCQVDFRRKFYHPSMGKNFLVQSVNSNLEEGTSEVTMKEIDEQ